MFLRPLSRRMLSQINHEKILSLHRRRARREPTQSITAIHFTNAAVRTNIAHRALRGPFLVPRPPKSHGIGICVASTSTPRLGLRRQEPPAQCALPDAHSDPSPARCARRTTRNDEPSKLHLWTPIVRAVDTRSIQVQSRCGIARNVMATSPVCAISSRAPFHPAGRPCGASARKRKETRPRRSGTAPP